MPDFQKIDSEREVSVGATTLRNGRRGRSKASSFQKAIDLDAINAVFDERFKQFASDYEAPSGGGDGTDDAARSAAAAAQADADAALAAAQAAQADADNAVSLAQGGSGEPVEVEDTTARNAATAAQNTANTANTAATAAQTAAESALAAANEADDTADAAQGSANTALTNAATALTAAQTADGKAVTADTKATNAQTAANAAQAAADEADDTADAAQATANTANSTANTALTNAASALAAARAREVQIAVIDFATSLAVGNGKAYLNISPLLAGKNLVYVNAKVITAGVTGLTTIALQRIRGGATVAMLSTNITIDSAETGSETAAAAPVINTANDDVLEHDLIRIDITTISTTAPKGLIVTLGFAP